ASQKRTTGNYFAKFLIVLLIKCREVQSDIWEAIDDQLLPRDVGDDQRKRFFDFIRHSQSEVLLVLDGLDEVSEKLPSFSEIVEGRVLPKCRVVVTARHEAGVKVRKYCDTLLEVEGFTDEDARSFIKLNKYFKTGKKLANELTDRLHYDRKLGAMAANPLNCALFCLVWEEINGSFPESRSELYVDIVKIKLSHDCFSEWEAVPAGVPQGTKLGPWLFLIMINNLSVADTIIWKYVDDTTLVESVLKNESSYMQLRVNELVRQSEVDGFQFNESKCKELRISFSRSGSLFDHITINDKQIEVVSSARLLGVIVSDNLRWNAHVESICKKAAKRLYFLKQLKRAKVPSEDMLLFYTTCIRPVLEYACPVFHHSLPQYLSNEMERLQKRALRMIQPDLSYAEALVALDIASLYERREILCDALFDQIVRDENHKLHDLLPPRNESTYRTRSQRHFKLPISQSQETAENLVKSVAAQSNQEDGA
ncbi:RNA-directed DNA polymerase from mobile element jockey, partial [Stylophora pistillata]